MEKVAEIDFFRWWNFTNYVWCEAFALAIMAHLTLV